MNDQAISFRVFSVMFSSLRKNFFNYHRELSSYYLEAREIIFSLGHMFP